MVYDKQILSGKKCPYCGRATALVDSTEIYGRSYGPIYLCRSCDAYVGCHRGTTNAKGRLANAELREWKKNAHYAFDAIWKDRHMTRREAYAWLSAKMGLHVDYTHIGMFDVEECKRVVAVSTEYMKGR